MITSSGGGGHLQAANAKSIELKRNYPLATIYSRDILRDWFINVIGAFAAQLWNTAQASGNVNAQRRVYKWNSLAEKILWLPIFLSALFTFIHYDIHKVVDTQTIGTSAVIYAMRIYQKICGRRLILEKLLSDLPTEKTIHFFNPIKKLSKKNKQFIKVICAKPLLSNNQSERDFWQKQCRLDLKNIEYQTFPIRPGFHKYKYQKFHQKKINLHLSTRSLLENFLIAETMKKGSIHAIFEKNAIHLSIQQEEYVVTLMLGSQPNSVAILKYIQSFVTFARQSKHKYLLFIFCNHQHILLTKMHKLIQSIKHYPTNLSIIPMGAQEDSIIAPLYSRSNATITRSGGLTSMELLIAGKGRVWIHSEDIEKTPWIGMPIWELGNAEYLMHHLNAEITTPQQFQSVIEAIEQDLNSPLDQ